MAVGSNVNPNYPIPGLDQSSKGFRDNFATIKHEIENIQGTTIQLVGGVQGGPNEFGSGRGSIVIDTVVDGAYIIIPPPLDAIQYNHNGRLTGNVNLTYDPVSVSVGIGTSLPVAKLDVRGNVAVRNNVTISSQFVPGTSSVLNMSTINARANISVSDSTMAVGTITATPIVLRTNSLPRVTINANGNVGIGSTTPITVLDVVGKSADISKFYATISDRDSLIRATTSATGSTIGWGVEHRLGDALGGIRIDIDGTVSIHSGENMDADLSTSSARIAIDKYGRVGIGSFIPAYDLDVNGTFKSTGITDNSVGTDRLVGINVIDPFYTFEVGGDIAGTGALISNPLPVTVDTVPLLLDTWDTREVRSARYTIQILNGLPPDEQVDIIEYAVTHANGVAYDRVVDLYSTGAVLGTASVNYNDGFVELLYTGNDAGNVVKLSKTYITA